MTRETMMLAKAQGSRMALWSLMLVTSAACHAVRAQCVAGRWVVDSLVLADGRPAYVEATSVVPMKDGAMLLGIPSFIWASRDAFDPSPAGNAHDTAAYLARLRENHGFVGFEWRPSAAAAPLRPPQLMPMRQLSAVQDKRGGVHVFWFGPTQDARDTSTNRAVWYASRMANRWSAPKVIFTADRLNWTPEGPTVIVRESEVHVLTQFTRGTRSGIAYVRRLRDRWVITESEMRGMPSQIAAQLMGRDSIVVVYAGVGTPEVRAPNGQHLFVLSASTRDSVWGRPKRVQWSGLDAVRWTTLYHLETPRELLLLWGRHRRGGSVDAILTLRSRDGGNSWMPAAVLTIPSGADQLAHTIDRRGTVHLVVVPSRAHPGPSAPEFFLEAELQNGAWSPLRSASLGVPSSTPLLKALGTNELLLAWGEARPSHSGARPTLPAPVTMLARKRISCESRR